MRRILVVDDSLTSRAIAAKILSSAYEVIQAASGKEAIALAEQGGIDLIFLDLLMPGMDGRAVIENLHERGSRVPVVFMTADLQNSTRERLMGLGAAGIVNKPLTRDTMLDAASAILG